MLDIAAVFLPLLVAFVAGFAGKHIGNRATQIVACIAMLGAAVISIIVLRNVALHGTSETLVLGTWIESGALNVSWGIKIDALSAAMMAIVNVVSALVHVYAVGYMRGDKSIPRFFAYMGLFTFFMLALVTADNLLQMFFGWEGVGLCSYLLIGFWFERENANAAAIKAFLINRIGDIGFMLGVFGCFLIFDSVQFDVMFKKAPEVADLSFVFFGGAVPALTTVCLLLFIGAMGKSAQLGLHTWLPDAMEAPTPVSALIHAATMVAAGVFMIARLSPLFEYAPTARAVVAVVGALTALFGAAVVCTQFDIKRVLAWSTISQLGFMFFALGVSAYAAAMFHLMTHAIFKALLFLGAGSVIHALGGEQDMRKMGGLWRDQPITCACMGAGALALMGIGIDGVFGFAGFYSKDLILNSAIASREWFGVLAYVLGLAASFMTAFYAARLMIMTFYGAPQGERHAHESPWLMLGPLVVFALGAVFAGWTAEDFFGGAGRGAFWRDTLFALPEHDPIEAAQVLSCWVKLLPLVAALSGLSLAYGVYVRKRAPVTPAKAGVPFAFLLGKKTINGMPAFAGMTRGLYRLISNKLTFDEAYDFLFTRPTRRLGRFLWQTGDEKIIDGCGLDKGAALIMRLGRHSGTLQTGYVFHYAFVMALGIAGFVTWFWVRG
jgi:NADH-quinone oxidoreductase subunit L